MAPILCLVSLVLTFHTLSAAASNNPKSTNRGVKWIHHGRSVLVHLQIPGLPLWNQEEHIGEDIPSALILNFTVTPDNRTLLLQDQAFLPLPNPDTPPRLNAFQTSESVRQFHGRRKTNYENCPSFELDYERTVHPRDDPSIQYYNHHPSLTLNLLGAGIEGYNTLLKRHEQYVVKVTLKDNNAANGGHTTNPPNHSFEIEDVRLWERWPNNPWVGPDELPECTWHSWRCEEFGDTPWYRYIYRQDFDEFGKIGSLKHDLIRRWKTMNQRLGFWQVILLIFVVSGMTIIPPVYGAYKAVKKIKQLCKRREYRSQVTEWEIDDEEGETLLYGNDYEVDYREKEKYIVEDIKQQHETGVSISQKPLPPVPTQNT
ncbi:hypothetical protein BGZ60DRAFT_431840 [Tricladium varicosporioides]|nr:hypothetical protein BGZ60DRAFT_431840 [Hymenoscyphus varicosporioides]